RRVRELLRTRPRRLRLHLPPGLGDVGRPVLAPDFRRDPRRDRHRRSWRARGALGQAAVRRGFVLVILRAEGLRKLYGEFCALAADRAVREGALEIAELFGLGRKRHVPARHLPQGDKKLLDVASAFALRPQIILLDEPTSGVSTVDKTAIMETLVSASKRIGV